MIIVIIGPPGSGKSTQADLLARKLNVPSISMGQVLRDAKEARTILGTEANKFMEEGELVPSRLMEALTKFRLEEKDCENGFVLDGTPRRVEEAVMLNDYLNKKERNVNKVFIIGLPDKVAEERLLKRANKSKKEGGGREDDNIDDIRVRLREYYDNIEAVKVYYRDRDLLKEINGNRTIREIQNEIRATLQL